MGDDRVAHLDVVFGAQVALVAFAGKPAGLLAHCLGVAPGRVRANFRVVRLYIVAECGQGYLGVDDDVVIVRKVEDEVRTHPLVRVFSQQDETQLVPQRGFLVVVPAFDQAFAREEIGQDRFTPAALELFLAAECVGEMVGFAADLAALRGQLADRRVEALAQRRGVLGLRLLAGLEGLLHGRQVARKAAADAFKGLLCLAAELFLARLEDGLRAGGHLGADRGHLLLQGLGLLLAQGLFHPLLGDGLERAALPSERHYHVRERPHDDERRDEDDSDEEDGTFVRHLALVGDLGSGELVGIVGHVAFLDIEGDVLDRDGHALHLCRELNGKV